MTVASNQFQNHNQLLRHGMLNWVTRGVFLGYQRNYLELQIDDLFLGDDAWDEATNTTSYDPARREPDDARPTSTGRSPGRAPAACGSTWPSTAAAAPAGRADGAADPLTAKFADPAVRNAFGYVNHTLDHPNLDCSTSSFIARQITRQPGLGARPRAAGGRAPPRSSPASTPGWRTRGPAIPARSTRRRSTTSSRRRPAAPSRPAPTTTR